MKAIHADPKEIRKIFSEKYIIPDFQRPYSWEKEQCDKLWEDLIDFYENEEMRKAKFRLIMSDNIHPNKEGYIIMSKYLAKYFKADINN